MIIEPPSDPQCIFLARSRIIGYFDSTWTSHRINNDDVKYVRADIRDDIADKLDAANVAIRHLNNQNDHLRECLQRLSACTRCDGYGIDPENGNDSNPEPACERCRGSGVEQ